MNERFAQYSDRLKNFWGQMGRKQKIWLGASISGILLTIILLTIVFTRTEYELAFQNLDATDAAAVMTYLDGNSIPYELSAGGTSIMVPSTEASRVKVDVGSQGLVQNGSIGFEVFSSNSSQLGTTENEFNVIYQNALNGEVQKLLNGLKGVEGSKVLINSPEESVFLTTEDAPQASAAIVMKFEPGFRPTQKDIDGYYNLVQATVADLAIKDITISSTQHGELVSSERGGIASGNADVVDMQFQIQKKYESELEKNIQGFLGPIVGSDNLVVSVSSSMNFDKKLSQENLVLPLENNNNNGILLSEESNNSSSTGSSGQAGGVAGTGETDIPGYDASGQENSTSETSSQIKNYEVNRINNSIESGPFVLKDLSISIGIEAAELNDEASRTAVMNYLTTLVRSQLADSGQDVSDDAVINKKVSLIARTFAENPSAASANGISLPWVIGIGIAVLALIGGLIFMLVRKRKQQEIESIELVSPSKVEYPTLDLESVNNDSQARKNLETLAKRKPDEFVNLLRTWLVDE
ncbi:flagellar basal-body MS-ring/collar protein FliF [Paenibacillus sp. L3-i20]|uniref:flagellar basal-body MS-ring/collar protein FliF n=1 Tax=Paenibacillus sp. L3-i20 TaxID=2905833 RepID=UPI001EDE93E7|nr:flagellar basal-body MS-ring/collar protein FliF [Paenibacillus sp. L3-i20]GKU78622.1 flagellar M-ring protein [Paenibacillus sp. L3-i20]